jgi:hypothetical protein
MRLLDKYIGREVASHSLLGLAVFTFVFFVPQLVRLMDLVVRHSGGVGTVSLIFLCSLTPVLAFTVPMAVLVGVLIGLGRLSADSEIVALHASGISLRRLLLRNLDFDVLDQPRGDSHPAQSGRTRPDVASRLRHPAPGLRRAISAPYIICTRRGSCGDSMAGRVLGVIGYGVLYQRDPRPGCPGDRRPVGRSD